MRGLLSLAFSRRFLDASSDFAGAGAGTVLACTCLLVPFMPGVPASGFREPDVFSFAILLYYLSFIVIC